MAAPATLCQELRRLRDRGLGFDEAWNEAVSVAIRIDCDASDWLHVFAVTRGAWESGYNREVSRRREIATAGLNTPIEGASTAELPCGVLLA